MMKNRKRKIWRKQAKAELSAVFIANLNEKDDKIKTCFTRNIL